MSQSEKALRLGTASQTIASPKRSSLAKAIEAMGRQRQELPKLPSRGSVAETIRRLQKDRRRVEEALESRRCSS